MVEKKKPNPLLAALSWTLPANIITGVLNFIGQIVFARILGITSIAQYGIIVVNIEMILLFFSFGFNQAAIKKFNNTQVFAAAYTLIFFQSIIILFCYFIFCFFRSISIQDPLFFYGLVYVLSKIIGLYTTLAYAPLEGSLNYKYISIYRLLSVTVGVSVGICLALYHPGIYTLITRDILIAAIMFFLIKSKCPLTFTFTSSIPNLKFVWQFCRPIWALSLLERGALRGNYAITAMALGRNDFGIYFQVRNLFEGLLGFIVQPIQTVIYAYFCKKNISISNYKSLIIKTYPIFCVSMLLITYITITTSFGSFVVESVLGDKWKAGGEMVGWLTIYILSTILFEFSKVYAIASDNKRPALIGRLAQLFFLAVFIIPIIKNYGLVGSAFVTAAGGIILFSITTFLIINKG